MLWTALDTETRLASNREPVPELALVGIANDLGAALYAAHDPALLPILRGVWAGGVVLANGPFDVFVLLRRFPELWPLILQAYLDGRVWDVLTAEKALDIAEGQYRKRGGYNLGAVAARRGGVALDKHDPWRKRYGEVIGLEVSQLPREAFDYAIRDPYATWIAFRAQQAERARHRLDVFADLPHQARAHLALYAQTLRGMHTDPARVEALDAELGAKIHHLEQRCLAAGLARPKSRKPDAHIALWEQAAREWLAAMPGVRLTWTAPSKTHPKGQISLGEQALDEAGIPKGRWGDPKRRPGEDPHVFYDAATSPPEVGDPPWGRATQLAHPLECFRAMSMRSGRSKNIAVLRHPIIRTRFDELVSTGRVSASGFKKKGAKDLDELDDEVELELDESDAWVGTNTQNWDHSVGYRECIVPPPPDDFSGPDGYMLGITDFGALELVTFAQVQLDVLGHSALADLLRSGKCPHSAFGAKLRGVPYEQFDKSIPEHFDARQLGKAWNFGKPGMMGEARFIAWAWTAYAIRVTPEENKRYDAEWHAQFPEVKQYWKWIDRFQSGVDAKGRPLFSVVQPRSNRIRGGCYKPEAANQCFQGLGSDVAKLALWYLFLAGLDPRSPLYRCPQIIFAHDEHVTAIPRRLVVAKGFDKKNNPILTSPCVDEQERLMIEASRYWCPDVPMKVESKIVERYTK